MLNKIKNLLSIVPEEEIKDYYIYLYGEYDGLCKEDACSHILQYIRVYDKFHHININMMIKARICWSWLSYMDKMYGGSNGA